MKRAITTLVFDCFGVICEPVLNGWYTDNRLKHGFVDKNLDEVFGRFDRGLISENDIAEYFSKYDGVRAAKEEIMEQIDAYLKMDEGLARVIQGMRRMGFKTALLSNANASFFERRVYKAYPRFRDLFDEIVISSTVGMVKPNSDIYEYVLNRLDSKPTESLFIDDSEVNVIAAKNLGMYGFTYTDSGSFVEHLRGLGIYLDDEHTMFQKEEV